MPAPVRRARRYAARWTDAGPWGGGAIALKLRLLPKFVQKSLGICWRDCQINQVAPYIARWSQPFQSYYNGVPACGWFDIRLQLYSGAILVWQGSLR
ncbi:MAG: hypothetical protein U1E76_28185 [Planctomycetota bacterium]